MKMKRKILALSLCVMLGCQPLTACAETAGLSETEQTTEAAVLAVQLIDPGYSNRDLAGTWEESETVSISLNGASAQVDGAGATAEGSTVTVTAAGVYLLSGTLDDGRIIVDATKEDKVQLVLNGVSVTSSDGPAIHVKQADKVFVTLAKGTENILSDSENYTLDEGEDEPDAALYSKVDLTVNGTGSLTVNGNHNHGINSKDDLVIAGGTITVNAVNNGIRGKDSVGVTAGVITILSGGDGIKSTNSAKEGKGWVSVDGGDITITAAEGDGIQAETQLQVTGGNITIISGGGAENAPASSSSGFGAGPGGRGMGGGMPGHTGGSGNWNHSQAGVTAPADGAPEGFASGEVRERSNGGPGGMSGNEDQTAENTSGLTSPRDFSGEMPELPEGFEHPDDSGTPGEKTYLADAFGQPSGTNTTDSLEAAGETSDDASTKGLKAQDIIYITGGVIHCDSADDAIHSNNIIVISGGTMTLATGDDGIHADNALLIEDGVIHITESYEGLESATITITGGDITLKSSDDGVNASDGSGGRSIPGQGNDNLYIRMTGGTLSIDADGDGLDSNGNIFVEGGVILINGTSGGADSAIDYDGYAVISGGTVIAAGSSGMAQNFGAESTQPSLLAAFSERQSAGTQLTLKDSSGNVIVSYAPAKDFQCVVISSPDMIQGSRYTIYANDSEVVTTTLEDIITSISDTGEAFRTFGGGFGGMDGGGGNRGNGSEGSISPQPDGSDSGERQRPDGPRQQDQGSSQ